MAEQIVLLDKLGKQIGVADKLTSHNENTPLHLAFSCYVFNEKSELLVTKRANTKKVWPGVWTNSVCGHPAPGEDITHAIERRLLFELGVSAKQIKCVVPNYRYKTPPFKGVIENEVCPIYTAFLNVDPKPNKDEVEDFVWMKWEDFVEECKEDSDNKYSWWCKDQVKVLKAKIAT